MLTNKTRWVFFSTLILLVFIIIFFFLKNYSPQKAHTWDFERLTFNRPELIAYNQTLQEYNQTIFNYSKKKHTYSLNEYYNYFFFENKFNNFEELNNYLIEYNNIYKKNLQIKKKDIAYVKIKPDAKFQLRYYGDDVEKFDEFIEFMNNSIKNKILDQLFQQQKIVIQNVIYDEQAVLDYLKKYFFFQRSIYLNNLEFQLKNKTLENLTDKKNNKCLYYLGFQHTYSEIPQLIISISENKNYVFKEYNECIKDNEKKKAKKLSSDLNNSFLNAIISLNKEIIRTNIIKKKKHTSTFIKDILKIVTIFSLAFVAFAYRKKISLFFKNLNLAN